MEDEYTEDELDMVEEFMQTSHLSKLTVRVPSRLLKAGAEPNITWGGTPEMMGGAAQMVGSVRPPRQLPAAP